MVILSWHHPCRFHPELFCPPDMSAQYHLKKTCPPNPTNCVIAFVLTDLPLVKLKYYSEGGGGSIILIIIIKSEYPAEQNVKIMTF